MENYFDLSGKYALVTGASSGLGRHFALTLAKSGAVVVLAARRLEKLKEVEAEIVSLGGHAISIPMDVTDPLSVEEAFQSIQKELGRPCDIIVNNSGVGQNSWLTAMEEDEWDKIIGTNLSGPWRVAKQAVKQLRESQLAGSIVNIASITAFRPAHKIGAYAASKAAVDHLTRNMALEFARDNIRVNALAPGYFKTAINDEYLDSEAGEKMRKRVPMKRYGSYSELEAPLLLLASDAGSYLTGSTIIVDGGHTLAL